VRRSRLAVLFASLLLSAPAATTQPARAPDAAMFEGLRFRNIGPAAMGGRIDDFAVLESNPAVFYVAAATDGLWKTTTNGTTWEVLFNEQDDVVSIGDVATAPTDANVVWVGTGENNNRQSSSWGTGVFKSTDAGRTWKLSGLADARHIGRIVVDPSDHDVVYVAALGHLFGPKKERGVYKTTDGGVTWSNVLFVDEDTGATDLVMDPTNHKVQGNRRGERADRHRHAGLAADARRQRRARAGTEADSPDLLTIRRIFAYRSIRNESLTCRGAYDSIAGSQPPSFGGLDEISVRGVYGRLSRTLFFPGPRAARSG
jgi:hypothetical protein